MIRIRLISRFWPIGKLHQSIRPPKSALLPRLGNINNKSLPATGIPLSRYPAIPLPLPHDFPLLAINCSFSPASVNFHFLFLLRPMFQKLQSRALPSFLPSFLPDRPHKVRESLDTRLGRSKILACTFIYYHIYFIRLV